MGLRNSFIFILFWAVISCYGIEEVNIDVYPRTNRLFDREFLIDLKNFPGAFNPSLIKTEEGFLMSFRYCPNPATEAWISQIGLLRLNEDLQPLAKPQLVDTRIFKGTSPSQSEDARLFTFMEDIYLTFNDNLEVTDYRGSER